MTNAEKAETKKNLEKEIARGEPFEIVTPSKNPYIAKIKNEDAVLEIIELLIKRNLSYLEMNEVLYHTDRVLRYRVLSSKSQH